MQHDEIKREIIQMLERHNIDLATVVVGTGDTYYSKSRRFIFNARDRKEILEQTAKYAIKYFHKENIFILWEVYGQATNKRCVRRSCLNIDADVVLNGIGKTEELSKGIEFQWRNQEIVRVFDRAGLENYIANTLSRKISLEAIK